MTPMPRRILAVQIADIGDLILTTPALAALREAYPDAHITLLTSPHAYPVIDGASLIDEVIFSKRAPPLQTALQLLSLMWRLRRGRYDTTIFFHHLSTRAGALKYALLAYAAGSQQRIGLENGRGFFLTERVQDEGFGAKHQAQYWLELAALAGASAERRPATVAIHDTDRAWASANLPPKGEAPRIILHAGSGGYTHARRWPSAYFAAVAHALYQQFNAELLLVGGANDNGMEVLAATHAPILDLTAKTTLRQLAAVLETADLFIGADSGIMHLAAAANTPVLTLFGPSNADAWRPWTGNAPARVLRTGVECSPCSYVGTGIGARDGCPARTCLRTLYPKQVIEAASAMLRHEIPQAISVVQHPAPLRWTKQIHLLGLPVSRITYDEWFALINAWMHARDEKTGVPTFHHVCTINPEMIMIARRDPIFHAILQRAALTVPDGVGLLWAARQRGTPLPERVTGSDGVPRIAEQAARRGWKLFLLGAAPGVAEKTAAILRARNPDLHIVGIEAGSPAPELEDALVEQINASGADILFVAYGAPEQDKWIARNSHRLQVTMAMGVGGAFDFIAGVLPRAPLWMQHAGLEWLFRLYKQPWRFRRMLRLPRFVLAVLTERR